VLAHIHPDAGVPVIQLSINSLKPMSHHLELAPGFLHYVSGAC
jgi:4,5-DOPA dioxygenase extradiol